MAGQDSGVSASTVSSTTPSSTSVLSVIEAEALRLLRHYVTANTVLDVDLPVYAGILAETFYTQLQSRTAAGCAVVLSDDTFAELADYVRNNVDRRSQRRSSL